MATTIYEILDQLHAAALDESEGDYRRIDKATDDILADCQKSVGAEAGRALAGLHLNYETAQPYPLHETRIAGARDRVKKMRYARTGKTVDKTTITYNCAITSSGIPLEAQEYLLGSHSALDWIIERYQVKTDKASGILNDPNDWADQHGNARYILDLIIRIATVSVETVKIVNPLPSLNTIE
ncbi:type ISP restriction/modification enzyme [Rathayibacter soli]|uniref:type ISP restriction/modification enzyme n=1 Tax=Rathayibacter soli TaxID=3144168 RepID=UPI0027E51CEC|nr:type ISP restriction/modification enzyme [Glaciibacter superstes]